jgi:hypothetical protein
VETGDARFLKGQYVYKKISIEEDNEIKSNRRRSSVAMSQRGAETSI